MARFERERVTVGVAPAAFARWNAFLATASLSGPRDVPVRVDEATLCIGEDSIAKGSIGRVRVDLADRVHVVIEDRTRKLPHVLAFPHLEDASTLLDALERPLARTLVRAQTSPSIGALDVSRVFRRGRSIALLLFLFGLALLAALVATSRSAVWPFLLMVGIGCLAALAAASSVEVGNDGVRQSWVTFSRFVPWREIMSATARDDTVILTLRSGANIEIALRETERAHDLASRIDAGIAAHRAAAPDEQDARLLRREERVTAARVKELRDLGREREATYRDVRVARDRLWRIVEDPGHEGATRASAAVALSGEMDDAERSRLRAIAGATASPKVRVALEAVASSVEDAPLADALADVEAEEATRRA